jgi:protein-disulfide isomerase
VRALAFAAIAALTLPASCEDGSGPALEHKTVEISPFLGQPVMGDPAAPVEIVEYASTTCGHCRAFHKDELPELKAKYIDTGKARLVYRVLPTPPAQVSIAGAALARCAGEEKFFDVIADLFDSQDELVSAARAPRKLQQAFNAIGARHGLSADEVGTCLADEGIAQTTIQGVQETPATITGTPSFLVDGTEVEENTFEAVAAAIEAHLAAPAPN